MDYHEITSVEDMSAYLQANDALLAYFSHHNCNVCKKLKPRVRELIAHYFPKLPLFYINTIEHPDISAQFSVFSVPTILVFFDQKEYIRESRHLHLDRFYERIRKLYRLYYG
jgi:thioredoxin-like negative regulator of GroEL